MYTAVSHCRQPYMGCQDEEFEEYEGVYDDLNLDEEEEKFRMPNDESDSEDSEEASEPGALKLRSCLAGGFMAVQTCLYERHPRSMMKRA